MVYGQERDVRKDVVELSNMEDADGFMVSFGVKYDVRS